MWYLLTISDRVPDKKSLKEASELRTMFNEEGQNLRLSSRAKADIVF